jgi:hypothetical protein
MLHATIREPHTKIQNIKKHDRLQFQFLLYCIITAAKVGHVTEISELI